MNTHSAVDLCVSIIAAPPLLAIWYAIMTIVAISVETLNMEKNAVFHAADTLQIDSRPPLSPVCERPQWEQKRLSPARMFAMRILLLRSAIPLVRIRAYSGLGYPYFTYTSVISSSGSGKGLSSANWTAAWIARTHSASIAASSDSAAIPPSRICSRRRARQSRPL